MARVIGSALAGYLVNFLLMFLLMTVAWYAVGTEGAFQPGVWDVTAMWLVLLLAAAFVAALGGGYVTATISRDPRSTMLLMGIVVVLGILFALPLLLGKSPTPSLPRPDALPMFEAMGNGQQPLWVALLNPLVGAMGVSIGARLRRGASTAPAGETPAIATRVD